MTKPKLREDCIHINVCHVIGEYGTKGCVKSCPEYISHGSAKSDAVLDELEKWLYEEGMKFEKICDSEENFVNATGACARRAQCYYAIEKLTELRTKEREQG